MEEQGVINGGELMRWSIFNPETKKLRHENVFPQECAKAYDMGAAIV